MSAPSGNLIVVAGAGTGKTHKLVQTCVERLRDGSVSIDELLIVTFTKAAAAELRHRIGLALQNAFAENPGSAHLARQIALLDRAQISTLHSFCLELVGRHFSELGLSPRLMTLEAAQAAVLEHEALDALFETYYEAKTPETKAIKSMLLDWFRGEDGVVREIVRNLHNFTHTRPNPEAWFAEQRAFFNSSEPTIWTEWRQQAIQQFIEKWRPQIIAQPTENNPARPLLLRALENRDLAEIARLRHDKPLWDSARGSVKDFRNPVKKMYDQAELLAAWLPAENSDPLKEDWNLTGPVCLLLLQIAEQFGREFSQLKRQRGLVDFADLEQFTLALLNDENSPATKYCRARFHSIFVDEYQDINHAQDKIISSIARPAGNRFLVGDVKQSIYGFRHADPAIFMDYEQKWAGRNREFLTRNWRSHERILDFVNRLFTGVMTPETGGVTYDQNARLIFADTPDRAQLAAQTDSTPKVEVHFIDSRVEEDCDEEDETTDSLLDLETAEAEAEVVAALCQRLSAAGAPYDDIVILMRSPAGEVETYAKVFSRHAIPFDARRTGFFNCLEVLDLTNLLTILDNPLQDIPLLGVLRSPIGCFSIEDFASVRIASPRGPFWEALQNFPKARPFLDRYQRWRDLARHTSLAQRLEIILEETGYEDWITAQDRGPQRRANVRRLIELARQFDELHGEGLYPFLQYVEEQTKAVGDMAPATADSHGAVRLMSIHQSKGLQFPIVIVAGLHKKFNRQDFKGTCLLDDRFGLALKSRPPGQRRQYETVAFWMARQHQEKRLLDEEMRLLYVTLTRAENRLLLIASPNKNWRDKVGRAVPSAPPSANEASEQHSASNVNSLHSHRSANSMLDWIGPWLANDCPQFCQETSGQANDWTWRWHQQKTTTSPTQNGISPTEIAPEILSTLRHRLTWTYPFQPATLQEAKTSATRLRRGLADEPELARALPPLKPIKKNKLRANELGQAAHRLLELARFETFTDESALRAEMDRLQFTPEEKSALDPKSFLTFWKSPFGQELLNHAKKIQRELIFTAKFSRRDLQSVGAPLPPDFGADEFIVVQGAADLAAIFEKEIWLVDFKTDRLPPQLLPERVKEYSLQLRIYALALSRIYKRPVTRTCLHFLDSAHTEWVK